MTTGGATITNNGTGTVTIAGTAAQINTAIASITYTPLADYNGSATLSMSTSDGTLSASGTVSIAITAVADISNDTATTNEDTAVTFAPLGNDTFENAGRTITAINGTAITAGGAGVAVTGGVVTLSASGNLTFTPTANYNGTPSFTYTVTSGGVTETATVNMTVTAVNDAPTQSVPVAQTTTEDTAVVISGASVADVDGGTLTTTLSVPAGTGTLSVVTTGGATITNNGTGTVTIAGTAAQINTAIASITYTPLADYNGSATLSMSTSDGTLSASGTVSIAITAVADISNDTATTNEDTAVTFAPLGNDSFENAGRTITAINGTAITAGGAGVAVTGGVVTLSASGNLTFTPTANYNGTPSFTYTVTSGGVTETATVNMTVTAVNDAPTQSVPVAQTTNEDTAVVISGASVADVDGGTLTTTLSVPAGTGTLSVVTTGGATITNDGTGTVTIAGTAAQINTAIASITYTPLADYNGSATLSMSTSDGTLSASGTVSIAITAVADISNDTATTNEDTAVTFAPLTNDTFENAGRTISAINGTAITAGGAGVAVTGGVVTLSASGNLTFTPTANYNGTPSFTYTVTSGGVTETATVNMTVSSVNDAPTQSVPVAQTTTEDTAVVISGASVADVDGGTLTTTLSVPAGTGTLSVVTTGGATITNNGTGTVTIAGTAAQINTAIASITYTPLADYNGSATLSMSTSDGSLSASGTVSIAITAVADISNDTATTNEDTAVTFNAITGTNGATADSFEGTPSVTSVTQPTNGSVTFAANGSITYTPSSNFNGTDTFTYTVTSGGVQETATVTVTVAAVNDAPVNTVPGDQSTNEDANLVFSAANGNAITIADVDSTVTTTLTVANGSLTLGSITGVSVTGNGTGTVTITGSASAITAALSGLAFAPTADWNGATTLNVSTSDGLAPAAVNAVAITVAPVVDIATDSVTVTEDVSQTFNVLTNDSFENAGATVSSVTQPTHGVVSIGSGGNVTYTPSANYNGSDSFTYTVTSGGVTETTTVTLNVTAVNDAPVADDETGTATEDTTLTVPAASGLLVGDTDADNNPLTITQFTVDGVAGTFTAGSPASIPNVGTLTINADGSYTFVPASNFNGPVPAATYTVSDNNGGFDTGTLTLAVTAVNDAPVAVDDTGLAEEDTLLSVSNVAGLLSNDGDVDSSPLTITQFTVAGVSGTFTAGSPASIPSVGVLTINADGSYTFNPALNYIGAVPVATYTVSDGNGGLDTGTLTIAVNPANDGPVNAVPGAQTVAEDVATAITGVSVSDIDGGTLTTTLTVTNGTLAVTLGGGATITGSGTGTITLTGTAAEINSALDGLMFTGTADYSGPAILTVQTSDGIETDTDTVAITVTPVADITADTVATTEDSSISFNVLTGTNGATADTFEGTPSVTAYTQPANGTVTIAANGSVVYVPNANFNGTDTFTYTVTSGGVTETTTVTVNVAAANDAPAQTLPGDQSTSEDTNVVFSGANGNQIIIADIDAAASVTTTISVPAGSLTALATAGVTITGNATGTVTLTGAPAAVTAALNGLTYTPVADYNGAITMSVSTTDGVAAPVSGTVDIDISPVVDIQADTLLATEDTAATISVLSNDTFENAGRTVTSVTQGSNGSVAINGNGTITYVPNANFNGTDSFTYTVTSGGVTETVTVSVVVAAANDAVTQSVPASQTVVEDAALTFSAANGNAITVADIDGDSLTTTISVTNGVIDLGSITGITVSGDGTATVVITGSAAAINAALEGMTYSPVADYYGAAGMTVSTTDGATTASGTVPLAITAVVDISDDAQTTGEDTAIVFNVLSNDSFEGSSEFVSAVTQPANGSVSIGAGGQITYTPNANFNGTDTFTYTVTSGGVTETATVEVIVTPANDALIASVPSAQSVNEDTPLVFSSSNGNAITVSDIDGDTINMTLSATNGVLTLAATAGLTITGDGTGTITLSGSAAAITAALEGLEFAPDADYNGAAVLSISATDGTATTSQTVPVTINAVADIVANTVSTNEDTAVTFNALANDSFESSGRAVTSVTQGASGSVSFLADGTLVYTPNTNFHGVDTFSYTVTSNGTTETTTVTVNVAAVNDAPTTTGITNVSNVDGATVLIDVTSSFADVDSGDVLTYTASGLPAGLLIDSATGVISGTIDKNASQSGPYTVAVTASDGNPGGTVSTSFTWTVTNPGPTANNDAITVAEDAAPTTISVLANDTDPDGDALSVTGATASNGTVSILAGGTISYQPAANFNGTDTIVYQISDGNGGVSTATVTVTVTAVNDAPVADDETGTATEDTTLTVPAASGLLVGDTDVDGNPLTITQFTVAGVTGTFTAGSPASIRAPRCPPSPPPGPPPPPPACARADKPHRSGGFRPAGRRYGRRQQSADDHAVHR